MASRVSELGAGRQQGGSAHSRRQLAKGEPGRGLATNGGRQCGAGGSPEALGGDGVGVGERRRVEGLELHKVSNASTTA